MKLLEAPEYRLTRFVFQRALALIYVLGFLIVLHQYVPLVGQKGLLPIRLFLERVPSFWNAPSLFWWNHSDGFLLLMAACGLGLALAALSGASEAFGTGISALVWFLLWALYLSFVNVGQTFYGFGWESILLETGFLAVFLGPAKSMPPRPVIWGLRWVLFRVMFGAGMIKLRGDACWLDLTCMNYHYETQPVPNPLSWYFHHLPPAVHKGEVLLTHFVELAVPWAYFLLQPAAAIAGGLSAVFQIVLILSGNLSWLNYMTLALCIPCFDDRFFPRRFREKARPLEPMGILRKGILGFLAGLVLFLSIRPALNLFSERQMMNATFDPLHLVNTYGAFGTVTRQRREVVLEGTADAAPGPESEWREYEFKCKPGSVARRPCVVSPYHYRLDWQIWFAAMSSYEYHPWLVNFAAKLLKGDEKALGLLAGNPFPEAPPRHVRAILYNYRFTTAEERRKSGHWWVREPVSQYLVPLSLEHPQFKNVLKTQGWLEE